MSGAARAVDTTTVFNEVMYHPAAAADPEWIELKNVMAIHMDLSGWEITGGVNFTFPENTVIPAGGFLVVASNPGALQSAAGISGVLGPWTGSLNNGGETIRLRNRTGRVMDELNYNDKAGWPAGADGSGMSLTRRAGHLSGTEPEHWVASVLRGGTPGLDNFAPKLGPPQTVFGFADAWLYHDSSAGLPEGWEAATYNAGAGGWLSGNGVLAFEDGPLPAAVGTTLANPAAHPTGTYYFQKHFNFSGSPSTVQLTLRTLLDDGALIFLNGQEVSRQRLPGGSVTAAARASNEVGNAAFTDLVLPSNALVNGTNTLSVQVHQAGTPLGAPNGGSGGLTLNGLTLEETGGAIFTTNYSLQAGATAFAKDLVGNGQYAPTHTIPNLNNGTYSNPSSWIGNSTNSFCGVSFGSTPVSLARVAWGRDNTGTYFDRSAGTYVLEYTTTPNPTASTPANEWTLIGTATYPANSLPYSLRHAFSFPPVMATGIRLTVPGTGVADGACVDELEAGPAAPFVPVFKLMATGGSLDPATNMALTGMAFAKDSIPGFPIHVTPHLNDGRIGNNFSWIGGTPNSFCGISFPTARSIGRIAFARDNTGFYTDRTLGGYVVQYTTVPNPTEATPDGSWTTIGTLTLEPSIPTPSRRHVYEFAPVNATGIRLRPPAGACIDELEIYPPAIPDVVWGAALEVREIITQPVAGALRITEVAGTNAATWRVEVQNTGGTAIDVGGLVLAYNGAPTAGYTLPSQMLAPGAFLVLDQTTLGFRPLADDRVFLLGAGGAMLFDAVSVKSTTRARDSQGRVLVPTGDTFGTENTFSLHTDIVLNEVMYHFPPNPGTPSQPVTDHPEEWIEVHNKGASPVSLAGWSFDEGIAFTFPAGTTLAPGGYLVVAQDAAALAAKWPEHASRILGNFSGSLSNRGERLVLKDAAGNPADEIRYFTGGTWPALPDGGGASLELRDPRSDRTSGASWAASDESGDTTWQTVSYTMVAGQTFGQTPLWNEFRLGMLGEGECLVDDVSVVRAGNPQQLIQGGDFSSLTEKWRMLGSHGASGIEPEPGNAGNMVLRIRATGAFGWNHNHVETTFVGNTALIDGQSYTVSFRARWLGGSNQLNSRAYYSRLARTTELTLPTRIGTPGAQNSRFAANAAPALSGLLHAPAVPTPFEPVTVSLTARDPDGLGAVTLHYAINGGGFSSLPMTGSDSVFTAEIPGQPAGAIVQFYVQAGDVPGAIGFLPAAGANSRALYIVDEGAGSTLAAHEMRIVMLPADRDSLLAPLNRLSDGRIGGTAIYRRSEVFYDAGIRLQGTAAGRIRDGENYPGYDISFPADRLFRGVHDSVNIDRSGRGPAVRGQDEIYVKHLFHLAGAPCTYDDLVYLIAPASVHTGTAILQMAGYEGEFVDSQFDGDGTVFNLDGTYEPSTNSVSGNVESLKNPVPLATQINSDFTNLGTDKEQYRGQLEPRAGRRRDDFTGLIPFCQTMALPNAQLAVQMGARMDVDEWMRVAAIYSLWGVNDAYMTGGFAHNLRIHVPSDGLNIRALPWDMDFVMNFPATSSPILAGGNMLRVINNVPGARHKYYGHLHHLCTTKFTSAYFMPWLEHYGSVVGQTMTGAANYIEARRNHILSQLPANVPFAITTNGGADFSVHATTATLTGTGWIHIREIRRADTDAKLDITWLTDTTWQVEVGLSFGPNPLTLVAYDYGDVSVATDSIAITSTLPSASPRDSLRITEIHYRPAAPSTPAELAASTDAGDFEFIELRNIGPQAIDISGCEFKAGVDFTFADNTMLAPGETIHVVRHVSAFQARYGLGPRVAGAYGPGDSLNNGGETLSLFDATGAEIQSFAYDNRFPWPVNADGQGYSLVAIAPHLHLDRNLSTSWRASATIGGNPGGSDSAPVFTGNPEADLDGDGLTAFLEHTLGTSDNAPDPNVLSLSREAGGTVLLTVTSRLNADDAALAIESSATLPGFGPASATIVTRTQNGSSVTQTWRLTPPAGALRFFVRLKSTAR